MVLLVQTKKSGKFEGDVSKQQRVQIPQSTRPCTRGGPRDDYFIGPPKRRAGCLNGLVERDRLHDQKDAEHDRLIESIKAMAQAVDTGDGS